MRAKQWIGLFVLFVVLPVGAEERAAKITPEALAVLQRAIEARGGDEALAGIKGVRFRNTGTYYMGDMPMPFKTEMLYVPPNNFLWTLDAGVFKGAVGMKKGESWVEFMTPPARTAGYMKESIGQWIHHHEIMFIRPLLHHEGVSITLAEPGTTKLRIAFPDGAAYVVEYAEKEGKLRAVSMKGPSILWDGRSGEMDMTLAEPKPFGAITLASKLVSRTTVGGKIDSRMEETLVGVDWNPVLPEGTFDMPALTIELLKPALKQAVPFQGVAMVHEGPYDGLGGAIRKTFEICHEAGLAPQGQVMAIYLNDPHSVEPAKLRTEILVPVQLMGPPPTNLPEGVAFKTLPGGKVASLMARGPYGKVEAESMMLLAAWVGEQKHQFGGPPRAIYYHNPDGYHPDDQVSEFQIPLK